MGTPSAGKLFLQSLTGSGVEGLDLSNPQNFDSVALHSIYDIVPYSGGRLTCKIRVDQAVQNRYHTLHGGCIATLVDVVGSAALVTVSEKSGVSLSITVDYLRPGQAGEEVLVDAQVVKTGVLIATINVQLSSVSSGKLLAQGKHIKFLSPTEGAISQNLPQHHSISSKL